MNVATPIFDKRKQNQTFIINKINVIIDEPIFSLKDGYFPRTNFVNLKG